MAYAVVHAVWAVHGDTSPGHSRSPCPAEPDAQLRVVWADMVFDFRGCRTAVENFLQKWSDCHNPAVTAVEVVDSLLPDLRMPCEELWIQP